MNGKKLNVAMVPLNIKWGDKQSNLETVEKIFHDIHPQTDLIILPETFSTGFPVGEDSSNIGKIAESVSGETIKILTDLSEKYNVAIAGSFIAKDGDSLYNRGFIIEPSGEINYSDKYHLFTIAGEHKIFTKGNKRLRVRFRGWNIALIICYDLRFPVWCRNVNNEYDLLIVVANWPEQRADAWQKLLYARAIENQAYVCGVDCNGIDNEGNKYNGCSLAIDYKGKDISVKVDDERILYASLDLNKLKSFREKFAAWQDADRFQLLR